MGFVGCGPIFRWIRGEAEEGTEMKRLFAVLLTAACCLAIAGCPKGKSDGNAKGDGDGKSATDGAPAKDGAAGGGAFKQGVDSGRSEDGSDEDK